MATAIDSGVDTGNDSNDSCVQERNPKMDIDTPQAPENSVSSIPKYSTMEDNFRINHQRGIKDLNDSIIPNEDFSSRISFLHLPKSLSHGYEVNPLQNIRPNEKYKNEVFVKKMKIVKCRIASYDRYKASLNIRRRWNHYKNSHLTSCLHGESGSVRMCRATCVNNVDAVKEMLESGMSPNCFDCFQRTPLHIASCMGYKDMVELLLQHGADPNAKDRIGNTPLHLAACTNHIEVIKHLLKAGTNVLEKDFAGHSPLHFAVTKFNIMSRSQSAINKNQVCQVIAMLARYLRVEDKSSKVDNDLLVKFENLLHNSKCNEPVDSGVRELLNNLSSLSISNSN
uniref:Uncharacterized protein n=1 Tax=Clastoptera arizonana TaxID=38151 RepID=A0A1B6CIV6_9HEMI